MKSNSIALLIFFAALFGSPLTKQAFANDIASSIASAEQVDTSKDIREVCESKSMSDKRKSEFDEKWTSVKKHFDELIKKGEFTRRFVEEPRQVHYLQFGIIEDLYQGLTIEAFCFKKYRNIGTNFRSYFDSCTEEEGNYNRQMLIFTNTYGKRDDNGLNITACKAKSERLDIELYCPPYDWMLKLGGANRLKAYDARAFLECVRK